MFTVDVVLRIGIGVGNRHLGMRLDDVIGLHERFHVQLPVGRDRFVNMAVHVAVLELPGLDMRHKFRAEILRQRRRGLIHVDEYEPAQALDPGLWQRKLLCVHMRKIPLAGHLIQRAIDIPAPAVEADT